MVTGVLVVMVGTTVQILQTVGWLPVSPIAGLRLPYWTGMWFGFYPTWEGVAACSSRPSLRDRQLPGRGGRAQAPPQPRLRRAPGVLPEPLRDRVVVAWARSPRQPKRRQKRSTQRHGSLTPAAMYEAWRLA